MSNNPNWRWVYTYSVDTTIPNTDVRLLFTVLSGIKCEYIGMAWEFREFRRVCGNNGFVLKDIKRRRWVPEEPVQ